MRCCTGGLDLIGEFEGKLKMLGHVWPTLVRIVKSDTCEGQEHVSHGSWDYCYNRRFPITSRPSAVTSGLYAVSAAHLG
jgi:hypothetical protein